MSRKHRIAAASIALALAGSAPAGAQVHDHLKCFKVKDPSSFSATVDLRPADVSSFEVDAGCSIKVRSRQLCIPVDKYLVASDGPSLDVTGASLANSFLCYRVRCPEAGVPASLQMSDQFGTRTLTGLRTSTVCAPAITGAPPVTTTTSLPDGRPRNCTDAAPPRCDGTCNDFNFACVEDAGACICRYVDITGHCPMLDAGPPNCWGSCEGTNTCLETGGGCACGFAFE